MKRDRELTKAQSLHSHAFSLVWLLEVVISMQCCAIGCCHPNYCQTPSFSLMEKGFDILGRRSGYFRAHLEPGDCFVKSGRSHNILFSLYQKFGHQIMMHLRPALPSSIRAYSSHVLIFSAVYASNFPSDSLNSLTKTSSTSFVSIVQPLPSFRPLSIDFTPVLIAPLYLHVHKRKLYITRGQSDL